MKLYVANCSKQHHWFTYRYFGHPQATAKMIKAGGQICVDNLEQEQVDAIIKQHSIYNMLPAKEMSRRKDFAGLCYNVDSPINVDRMLETFDKNDEVKDAEAVKRREDTAAAMSENIGKELGRLGGVSDQPPSRLEVEVREEGDSPSVNAGVEVLADPSKTQPRRAKAN